jgi:adenylate cyclase
MRNPPRILAVDDAKDGQILLSHRVATAVAELVQLTPVGELSLKGLTRPVAAYDVVGPTK